MVVEMNENDLRALGFEQGPDGEFYKPRKKPSVSVSAVPKPSKAVSTLNKTETRFWRMLEARLAAGELRWVKPHPITFRMTSATDGQTKGMTYTPDFVAVDEEGRVIAYDTKGGHTWEDSIIKMKAASALFPWICFIMAIWKAGKWSYREFQA